MKLEPDYPNPHYNKAFTYFIQRRFDRAVEAFQKYSRVSEQSPYEVLWHYLSLKQLGKEAEANDLLKRYRSKDEDAWWALQIHSYFRGELSEQELLARSRHKCDLTEALVFVGSQHFLQGNLEGAGALFRRAADEKVYCFYEYVVARARLEQMRAN